MFFAETGEVELFVYILIPPFLAPCLCDLVFSYKAAEMLVGVPYVCGFEGWFLFRVVLPEGPVDDLVGVGVWPRSPYFAASDAVVAAGPFVIEVVRFEVG